VSSASGGLINTNSFSSCDVEQEVNGLYTYDRKEKVPVARVKAIIDAAQDYYHHVNRTSGLKKLLEHASVIVGK
jgi:hypothetical protein